MQCAAAAAALHVALQASAATATPAAATHSMFGGSFLFPCILTGLVACENPVPVAETADAKEMSRNVCHK